MKNSPLVRKPYQALAWFGTVLLIIGASMTALNIFPMNVYIMVFANGIWLFCGYLWREPSVIGLNFAMTVIYVIGVIKEMI
tara:strand:+ start:359 stop:601 length:243 start_codon:yes stop_codon:yes gene_type:complete